MSKIQNFDKYDNMNIFCAKLECGKQIYFMTEFDEYDDRFDKIISKENFIVVTYPMTASMSPEGVFDFEQYVEYSSKSVCIRFKNLVAVSRPVEAIQNLYMKAIRRLEFLNEQPESAKKILQKVSEELKILAEQGKKITFNVYREEIIKQTDRLLDNANGLIDEELPDYPDNVITFTGKPTLQ